MYGHLQGTAIAYKYVEQRERTLEGLVIEQFNPGLFSFINQRQIRGFNSTFFPDTRLLFFIKQW